MLLPSQTYAEPNCMFVKTTRYSSSGIGQLRNAGGHDYTVLNA